MYTFFTEVYVRNASQRAKSVSADFASREGDEVEGERTDVSRGEQQGRIADDQAIEQGTRTEHEAREAV